MSVAASGKVCAEASRLSSSDISKVNKAGPLNIGDIQLTRFSVSAGAIQGSLDSGEGTFRRYGSTAELMSAAPESIAGLRGAPSPGSCVVSTFDYGTDKGPFEAAIPDFADPAGQQLDAGANLRFTNAQNSTKQIAKQISNGSVDGYYLPDQTFLGGGLPAAGIPQTPDFLIPGSFRVDNSTGGSSVGAFTANLTIPSSTATWTNQASINTVTRSQNLTVTWTGGGASDLVAILGSSADPSVGAGAGIFCVERASAGTFTIPAYLLSNLPASGLSNGVRVGWLTFGTTLTSPTRFTAPGLDLGYFNWLNALIKNVTFQ
jgi:hypothetical protein